MIKRNGWVLSALFTGLLSAGLSAQAEELRLLTWGGYAPQDVVDQFEKETGIKVKVTKSNNEDMISRLRATRGAGFDLVQPSQDRIVSAQKEYRIYKPMDLSKLDQKRFITSMLDATSNSTRIDDDVYGVPHVWGTSGLIVSGDSTQGSYSFNDLCSDDYKGKVSYRLKRPTLIGFAFAMGEDPFAAYNDEKKYAEILVRVEQKLVQCKSNVKAYWTGGDALINLLRSGEVTLAMGWDAGGWKLHKETGNINFVAPESGALGWIDTFALPAKGRNDEAAYQWINFVMQPEIAARITSAAGNFTAAVDAENFVDKALSNSYKISFNQQAIDNIKWYPPVPAGLETIEGQVLDRIKAAR
ncbi:spermidine/putrescine ABC transporter substrate-binding protein [Endozoicomonas montiporae]|uniref:Spermidine/putrescine ABC transporter substrate-binding protein n=1 Tax=Endozoicomonas montiporae TaxID=1027273 RepID=A0A081MYQ1_9GAMM|nr:extracellular solute-binding protein [Endozoicomonas montiporae]KEQ11324.1 spermidine/putrescine ABC transporter substrate-binding protein [Endozoicomonas montiporae]